MALIHFRFPAANIAARRTLSSRQPNTILCKTANYDPENIYVGKRTMFWLRIAMFIPTIIPNYSNLCYLYKQLPYRKSMINANLINLERLLNLSNIYQINSKDNMYHNL